MSVTYSEELKRSMMEAIGATYSHCVGHLECDAIKVKPYTVKFGRDKVRRIDIIYRVNGKEIYYVTHNIVDGEPIEIEGARAALMMTAM